MNSQPMAAPADARSGELIARADGHVELRDDAAVAIGLLRDVTRSRSISVRTDTPPTFGTVPLGRTTIARLRLGPFESVLPDSRRTTGHDWLTVLLQNGGSTRFQNEDHTGISTPGQILIYDTNKDTAISSDESSDRIVLSFPKAALPTPLPLRRDAAALIIEPGPGLPRIFHQFIRAAATEAGRLSRADRVRIDRSVLFAVSDFLESQVEPLRTRGSSALTRTRVAALHMIETDLAGLTSTAELAARLNCSERHLFLAFRAAGLSPARHIQNLRLQQAKAAIAASSELSIAEIAYAAGFQSYAHFSRSFKQAYGVSPRSWRAVS